MIDYMFSQDADVADRRAVWVTQKPGFSVAVPTGLTGVTALAVGAVPVLSLGARLVADAGFVACAAAAIAGTYVWSWRRIRAAIGARIAKHFHTWEYVVKPQPPTVRTLKERVHDAYVHACFSRPVLSVTRLIGLDPDGTLEQNLSGYVEPRYQFVTSLDFVQSFERLDPLVAIEHAQLYNDVFSVVANAKSYDSDTISQIICDCTNAVDTLLAAQRTLDKSIVRRFDSPSEITADSVTRAIEAAQVLRGTVKELGL